MYFLWSTTTVLYKITKKHIQSSLMKLITAARS